MIQSIQLHTVESAAEGRRAGSKSDASLVALASRIFEELRLSFDAAPYVLFGHSMGAVVICELLRRIYQYRVQKPLHVFLSGRNPIHISNKRNLHELSDEDFKNEILKLGGTPKELFENKKLANLFIPALKTDLTLLENYHPEPFEKKWDVGISVLNGITDSEVEIKRSHEWQDYTTGVCLLHTFEGGHFFINEKMFQVVEVVNNTLHDIYLQRKEGSDE